MPEADPGLSPLRQNDLVPPTCRGFVAAADRIAASNRPIQGHPTMAGVLAAMGVWIASVQESVGERRHRPPATPRLTGGVENEPSPGALESSRAEMLQAPAVSR